MSISQHRYAAEIFENFFLVPWVMVMMLFNFEVNSSIFDGDTACSTRQQSKRGSYLKGGCFRERCGVKDV